MDKYYKETQGKTPEECCTILENSVDFKNEHKGFANQGQSAVAATQEEVKAHFIAFVINENKQLIELDGMKKGPNVIAEGQTDVLRATIKEIQRRLEAGVITDQLNMMTLNPA